MLNPVIAQAIEITETYKKHANAPLPIREALCNKIQYPGLLPAPNAGDRFAGRSRRAKIVHVGAFAFMRMPNYDPNNLDLPGSAGKNGGYCFDFGAKYSQTWNDEERKIIEELDAFWRNESNMALVRRQSDLPFDTGFSGATDLDRVVRRGLPGLIADVTAMPAGDFREGLLMALESMTETIRFYQREARKLHLTDMEKDLSGLLNHAPQTVAEALQLILICELLFHERHYEIYQLDVALGDLYAKEIDGGTLTEGKAVTLIRAFYEIINESGDVTVCRLVMGGKGRRNPVNADRFIKAALTATELHMRVTPQVTVRIFDGMDAGILTQCYDTIRDTGTYPLLYNDDAVIPAVVEAFGVSEGEAESYFPVGCGEFILAPHGPALLITNWNIPRTFDTALRSAKAETFDQLYANFITHAAAYAEKIASYVKLVIDTHNSKNAFLFVSLFTAYSIERNKPALDGGARYMGVSVMGHGYTNTADALIAIKKLVYEDKTYTYEQIIQALDADFAGYEDIHQAMLALPKYGNDYAEVDNMVAKVWRDLGVEAAKAGKNHGLDFHTLASANPSGHFMGKQMGATADGRKANQAYAICNGPTAGNDKNGLTALMNSIMRGTPANGGATSNFKISHDLITKERGKFEALFKAYWAGGGNQASFAILKKGDLEAALKEPEKYRHVMIRIGGWTARFVDLEPFVQEEVLRRTLH
jgi:pyruvate-formate lyase